MKKLLITGAVIAAAMFAMNKPLKAQPIYTNTFNADDSANWVVNFSYTASDPFFSGLSNSLVNFDFDYTTIGIPIAPHSVEFGSDTIHHGLKMSAVYTNHPVAKGAAVVAGISASPTNFSVTSDFVMHADMWINVNCGPYATLNTNWDQAGSFADNSNDGSASTVLYGCGYGTAGNVATTPGVSDAIFCGFLTDNGSSAQVRMYGPSAIGQSSYQNNVYQSTGTTTPGFPGDPLVYNIVNPAQGPGTRNVLNTTLGPPYTAAQTSTNLTSGVAWRDIFPPQVCPLLQQTLYPQQTNNCSLPGFLTFGWHDAEVDKIGQVIVYKVDNNILATGNYSSAGTPAGSFLTFVATRTSLSAANPVTAANYTNLNFVVFANIVVSNYDNVVNVSAPTPTTAENGSTGPAVFTITRGTAGVPITVNYTLTGTATNGIQYSVGAGATTTSVTLDSTATSTNIYINPIDDGVPQPTLTVNLTLQSGSGYAGAGSALVSILDSDTPTVDISAPAGAQAYGRYTGTVPGSGNNDYIPFTLTRRGQLTTGSPLTVNMSYGGTAVGGTDYTTVSSVSIPDGAQTATLQIVPLNNPGTTQNRTVIASVGSVTGGAVGNGPATGTIVSANYPVTSPVLLNDTLMNAADSNNWYVVYGTGDPVNDATNYSANFGYSLASDPAGNLIPSPPGGNVNALHLTCNKQNALNPAPGAVNCYYTNLMLTGNYAVRFNMNIVESQGTAAATEGPVFGINHTGTLSNWWYGSGTIVAGTWASDGVWYWLDAQPGGTLAGDYREFTGAGGTNGNPGWMSLGTDVAGNYVQAFKDNYLSIYGPFTCYNGFGNHSSGMPANGSSVTDDDGTWSDVEIKQVNNVVTMSINHTAIFVYTNTTVWTSGYLMLGYADPYGSSIATPEAGVYYANLQVVQLPVVTTITINSIAVSGGNVIITFTTSNNADTTSSFTLQSAGTVAGAFTGVSPAATITSLGSNQFQASTPYLAGSQLFYRIQHP